MRQKVRVCAFFYIFIGQSAIMIINMITSYPILDGSEFPGCHRVAGQYTVNGLPLLELQQVRQFDTTRYGVRLS